MVLCLLEGLAEPVQTLENPLAGDGATGLPYSQDDGGKQQYNTGYKSSIDINTHAHTERVQTPGARG